MNKRTDPTAAQRRRLTRTLPPEAWVGYSATGVDGRAEESVTREAARRHLRPVRHAINGKWITPEDVEGVIQELVEAYRCGYSLGPLQAIQQAESASKRRYLQGIAVAQETSMQQAKVQAEAEEITRADLTLKRLMSSISMDISSRERTFGVDTVRLFLTDFRVDRWANLDVVGSTMNIQSGEVQGSLLWKNDHHGEVHGQRATLNTDRFQLTIYGLYEATLQFSLPKQLMDTNADTITTARTAYVALIALQIDLMQRGIHTDVFDANLSRVDVACTTRLSRPLKEYGSTLRQLSFPRVSHAEYSTEGGHSWRNGSRHIVIYDKDLEQGKENGDGKTARLEYRMLKGRVLEADTDYSTDAKPDAGPTVAAMLHQWEQLLTVYTGAHSKLFDAVMEEVPHTDGETYSQLFDALDGERAYYVKALLAVGLAEVDLETFVQALGAKDRRAVYRLKKKIDKLQPYADIYRQAKGMDTVSDLYKEIKEAFAITLKDNEKGNGKDNA
mgnify:CR=1 FL=1